MQRSIPTQLAPGHETTKTPNGITHVAPDGTPRLLLNSREAARALSISERRLWSLTQAGLPCVRIGRSVRYSVDDLRNWINVQKKGGAADQ